MRPEVKLILFGNAILDKGKRLSSADIHLKHQLKLDDQLELNWEKLKAIERELDQLPGATHVSSGGSCLNTSKILSQLGERRTLFCGGIGADGNGALLEKLLDENQIPRCLQTLAEHPTALCVCLVFQEYRCLLANIGASLHFSDLTGLPELSGGGGCSRLQPLCYIEGYFIPQKMSICKQIVELFCRKSSPSSSSLVLNLNATYIVRENPRDVLWLFDRAHLVFGNRKEFHQLLSVTGAKSVRELLLLRGKEFAPGARICVVTDGANDVEYVRQDANNDITEGSSPVPKLAGESVVDSTGAGDSFVAGFLFRYLQEEEEEEDYLSSSLLEECLKSGISVAQRKLRHLGCTILGED